MITKELFGITKKGEEVFLYTIENEHGMKAVVSEFGAALVRLILPNGKDVVLGYDKLCDYEINEPFMGITVGRCANRTGGAAFTLNGTTYKLKANEHNNNLHSDFEEGFHKKVWKTDVLEGLDTVRFTYHSPDGENGFPGNLEISVSYHLSHSNSVKITYDAVSDQDTVVNVTNHSYFNLSGHDSGAVKNTYLTIMADAYTENDSECIPTGRIIPVEGTPMDFRTPTDINARIDDDYIALKLASGYDHNYVLHQNGGLSRKIAQVMDLDSCVGMEVFTDLPGVQFYTGNFIPRHEGKDGVIYDRRHGFALETQYFPDAMNKENFVKPILRAGERMSTYTTYHFVLMGQ